jgi:hypothetical protein
MKKLDLDMDNIRTFDLIWLILLFPIIYLVIKIVELKEWLNERK